MNIFDPSKVNYWQQIDINSKNIESLKARVLYIESILGVASENSVVQVIKTNSDVFKNFPFNKDGVSYDKTTFNEVIINQNAIPYELINGYFSKCFTFVGDLTGIYWLGSAVKQIDENNISRFIYIRKWNNVTQDWGVPNFTPDFDTITLGLEGKVDLNVYENFSNEVVNSLNDLDNNKADISALQDLTNTVDGIQNDLTNVENDIVDINTSLLNKAPISSPAFQGAPTAPAPTTSSGIATKQYVDNLIQTSGGVVKNIYSATTTIPILTGKYDIYGSNTIGTAKVDLLTSNDTLIQQFDLSKGVLSIYKGYNNDICTAVYLSFQNPNSAINVYLFNSNPNLVNKIRYIPGNTVIISIFT